MSLQRIYAIFLRHLYLMLERKLRLFHLFYWPVMELFLWGFLTVYLNQIGKSDFNFVSLILGAVILWEFLTRIQHGISISFLEDVWVRNFLNLFATPLSVNEYTSGLVLFSILQTVFSILFLALLAFVLFSYNILQFGMLLLPFVVTLFIFGMAVGIFTTALVLRFGSSAEFLVWSIPALFSPLSGVFYPVSSLPVWLQPFSYILAPSHIFEGMRSIVLGRGLDPTVLITAFIVSILSFLAAYVFLKRIYRYVLRHGLFTRFMTE